SNYLLRRGSGVFGPAIHTNPPGVGYGLVAGPVRGFVGDGLSGPTSELVSLAGAVARQAVWPSRTMRCSRSSTESPPQMPYGSRVANAQARQFAFTGQARQIDLARSSRRVRDTPRSLS